MQEQKVTPFEVSGLTNYDRLIKEFGCEPVTDQLISRFEELTGVSFPLGYRNFVISHRDFSKILDSYEKKEPFYLYTGRGPSSDRMHLGHLVPFRFCKFLQDAFDVPVVIQITDDEKCVFKNLTLEKVREMVVENVKDIIAVGFNHKNTYIFQNTEFIRELYPMMLKIGKELTLNKIMSSFGFEKDNTCVGKVNFPVVQMAPAFAETFEKSFFRDKTTSELRKMRCLIPCAIDQDPYFRLTRGIAKRMKHPQPAVIHAKFLPGLSGVDSKMSASVPTETIFLGDSEKQIRKKISKGFSGGQELLEDHQKLGGDPDKDVSFQLLTFFCDDNEKLLELSDGFRKGTVSCSEMKRAAADAVVSVLKEFQKRRENCYYYNRFFADKTGRYYPPNLDPIEETIKSISKEDDKDCIATQIRAHYYHDDEYGPCEGKWIQCDVCDLIDEKITHTIDYDAKYENRNGYLCRKCVSKKTCRHCKKVTFALDKTMFISCGGITQLSEETVQELSPICEECAREWASKNIVN